MSVLEIFARPWQVPDQRAPSRPRLRLVAAQPRRASRVPFAVLMLGILGIGLVGLLLVNTSLQQGSFVMHDLQTKTERLDERQGTLEQRVASLQAPDNLADRAKELGMVPNSNPWFLRLADGKVLGTKASDKSETQP